jgi:hypothetical protein
LRCVIVHVAPDLEPHVGDELFAKPTGKRMVRYILRVHEVAERPDITTFTIYRDASWKFYSYF